MAGMVAQLRDGFRWERPDSHNKCKGSRNGMRDDPDYVSVSLVSPQECFSKYGFSSEPGPRQKSPLWTPGQELESRSSLAASRNSAVATSPMRLLKF